MIWSGCLRPANSLLIYQGCQDQVFAIDDFIPKVSATHHAFPTHLCCMARVWCLIVRNSTADAVLSLHDLLLTHRSTMQLRRQVVVNCLAHQAR
jgi:hypothetical protein